MWIEDLILTSSSNYKILLNMKRNNGDLEKGKDCKLH